MLMEKEDEETQRFIRTERSNCQRERWAMQEEEQGLREYFNSRIWARHKTSRCKRLSTRLCGRNT